MESVLHSLSFIALVYSLITFFVWNRKIGNRIGSGKLEQDCHPRGPFYSPSDKLTSNERFYVQQFRLGFLAFVLLIVFEGILK